jgi:hypothetical protein
MAGHLGSRRLQVAALTLSVAGAVACGGEGGNAGREPAGSAGTTSTSTNPCASELAADGYEFADAPIATFDFEGTLPQYVFWVDKDVAAEGVPANDPGAPYDIGKPWGTSDGGHRPVAVEIPDGRLCGDGTASGSTRALHIQGQRLAGWGGGLEVKFADNPPYFDASTWDGLSFWVRRGPGTESPFWDGYTPESLGRTLFVGVADWHTDGKTTSDPVTGATVPVYCDAMTTVDAEKCDRFGAGIGLGEEWRFFAIPFASMHQQGFGMPAECLYTADIRGVKFDWGPGDWDIWIDDVAFYRGPTDDPPPRVQCDDGPPSGAGGAGG